MLKGLILSRLFWSRYMAMALLVAAGHFAVLHFFFYISWLEALADGFVSVILLAFFLWGLGFAVRFARSHALSSPSSIRNSILASLVLVALWLSISNATLSFIFAGDDIYIEFLHNSLLTRFFWGLFLAGITYLSFFQVFYQQHIRESVKRQHELQVLLEQTQLQAFKNQLNPHFIFNSLNAVSSLTLESPAKAREMVVMLSDFLRSVLRQDALGLVRLDEELQNISLYLQIEKVRFEEKLIWEIHVPEEHLHFRIPALILQPLFENAVKHGIQNCPQPEAIILNSRIKNNLLEITVSNVFQKGLKNYAGEGIGLQNIQNRLQLIYQGEGRLKIQQTSNKFVAMLTIPVKE